MGGRSAAALIVTSIEKYRLFFGAYPPDHVVSSSPLVVNPVNNQLLYELFGTVYDATNETFTPPHFPPIHACSARTRFVTT
jgi:hypothetical protein